MEKKRKRQTAIKIQKEFESKYEDLWRWRISKVRPLQSKIREIDRTFDKKYDELIYERDKKFKSLKSNKKS